MSTALSFSTRDTSERFRISIRGREGPLQFNWYVQNLHRESMSTLLNHQRRLNTSVMITPDLHVGTRKRNNRPDHNLELIWYIYMYIQGSLEYTSLKYTSLKYTWLTHLSAQYHQSKMILYIICAISKVLHHTRIRWAKMWSEN